MGIVYEGPGNLFYSEMPVLVCPVNLVGVMGNGLALYMKLRYPSLFPKYFKAIRSGELVDGMLRLTTVEDGRQILLFPTKHHFSEDSDPRLIETGLRKLFNNYQRLGLGGIAFPKIGCGKGNLSYDSEIKPLFDRYLGTMSIPIEIYLG